MKDMEQRIIIDDATKETMQDKEKPDAAMQEIHAQLAWRGSEDSRLHLELKKDVFQVAARTIAEASRGAETTIAPPPPPLTRRSTRQAPSRAPTVPSVAPEMVAAATTRIGRTHRYTIDVTTVIDLTQFKYNALSTALPRGQVRAKGTIIVVHPQKKTMRLCASSTAE